MASLTIRNMEEPLETRLRAQAADHGRSMEEEARYILQAVLVRDLPPAPADLAGSIRRRFAPFGGVELALSPREPLRNPPSFTE
ncbi:plasmid stabilization protein [Nitrospirillum sp. BR 11164]|uniref:FitA-like ribbon-helix-helix domain-containing protein n=1 Tax=Nitrospirillum sp. BR 11164 TaxID=3104324 RepID=UPI002AFFF155|nr:plasmid stabilization protein [Nitrospirillum sp. BR 11164]MEA1647963.1 plasmid stabilization protein [Nitrospirillum sp. BR 11164]